MPPVVPKVKHESSYFVSLRAVDLMGRAFLFSNVQGLVHVHHMHIPNQFRQPDWGCMRIPFAHDLQRRSESDPSLPA